VPPATDEDAAVIGAQALRHNGLLRTQTSPSLQCNVKITNPAAKGITDKDFELAKKIEEVVLWQPGTEGGALEGTPTDQRFAYIDYKKS
jgi:Pterin 4 alpha carbinolamine dehydratase